MSFNLYTALVTPFTNKGTINLKQFLNLIKIQKINGINDIVLFGTTGEGSLIPLKEKIRAFKYIYKRCPDVNYIIALSHISSGQVIEEMKRWNEFNIQAYLVLTPYYLSTNDIGLYKFYKKINRKSKHDLYIYHVPKRTGQCFNVNIIEDILNCSHVKGIKYAMDFKNVQMLMKLATIVNKTVPVENEEESEMVQMHIGMDGTGKMDVSIEKCEK